MDRWRTASRGRQAADCAQWITPDSGSLWYRSCMTSRQELPQLTGLRGIAALWVFLFHASVIAHDSGAHDLLGLIGGAGYLGVDVFFVLSGFVLALNYGSDRLHRSPPGWLAFLWKRLARIYPIHLATLALLPVGVLALAALDVPFYRLGLFTVDGLIRSLTLTHAWSMPIAGTWNFVSWSISSEWVAYLAFPLIAAMAFRLRSPATILAAVAALLIGLFLVIYFAPRSQLLSYAMARIAIEFPAGVLLCRLWKLGGAVRSVRWDIISCSTLVVLVAGSNIGAAVFGRQLPLLVAPLLACVLVYGLARSDGYLTRTLSSRGWLHAGVVSYAFYMVHGIVFTCTKSILLDRGLTTDTPSMFLAVVTTFVSTAAIAHWMHTRIEQPARESMIGWLARLPGGHMPCGRQPATQQPARAP